MKIMCYMCGYVNSGKIYLKLLLISFNHVCKVMDVCIQSNEPHFVWYYQTCLQLHAMEAGYVSKLHSNTQILQNPVMFYLFTNDL